MAVDTVHPQYRVSSRNWRRMRDVVGGQEAMIRAGSLYLRRPIGMIDDLEWERYVASTPFFEATQRTVEGLVGLAFYRPPEITLPAAMADFVKDATQDGVSLQQFVESTFEEVLTVARVGVLVDMPPPDKNVRTRRDEERARRRPFLRRYDAEEIINWSTELVNGSIQLTQVRLREVETKQVDEFTVHHRDRIRVLELVQAGDGWTYRQRVFVHPEWKDEEGTTLTPENPAPAGGATALGPPTTMQDASRWTQDGPDIVPLMNGRPLDYIPFWILNPVDQVAEVRRPPLLGLANLNVAHFNTTGSQENALFWVGHPQPWVAGIDPEGKEKLRMGSSEAWVFKDSSAKVGLLSLKSEDIGGLDKRIERLEAQMAVLGARMLANERRQVEAAETARIHRQGEISILARMAGNVGAVFEDICTVASEWAGAAGKVVVKLNTRFFDSLLSIDDITKAVALWQKGLLAPSDILALEKQAELIGADRTLEDIQAENESSPIQPIIDNLTNSSRGLKSAPEPEQDPKPRPTGTLSPRKPPATAAQ